MSHPLLSAFRALPDVHHVLQQVGRARLVDVSASDGTRPFLVAALAQQAQVGPEAAPVVVVTATTREAEDLAASLGAFLPSERVAVKMPEPGGAETLIWPQLRVERLGNWSGCKRGEIP